MRAANSAGVRVALTSPNRIVDRHKANFLRIIREHVDLLFGNYQEAQALTDTGTPREALRALALHSDLAVVTLDEKGSLIQHGDRLYEIPPYPSPPSTPPAPATCTAARLLYGLAGTSRSELPAGSPPTPPLRWSRNSARAWNRSISKPSLACARALSWRRCSGEGGPRRRGAAGSSLCRCRPPWRGGVRQLPAASR